ncbi:MAG: RpiB/LacA/LacB family sugar-phosphate isomerase [Candidatus Peregrinibacteria bacterium]|nr:RpiB/LacA/LacB family sugar-phosphate isomerase [Candidatus Peregrinibacteria bacterium]
MKLFLGSDHGGFELKSRIKKFITEKFPDFEVEDIGPDSAESVDYPAFGAAVGNKVVENLGSLGIVFCGSGIGISIAANKVKGVRCALANSVEMARLSREHNGANVLSMGERTAFIDEPEKIVETFLTTAVDAGERHEKRRGMLDNLITT